MPMMEDLTAADSTDDCDVDNVGAGAGLGLGADQQQQQQRSIDCCCRRRQGQSNIQTLDSGKKTKSRGTGGPCEAETLADRLQRAAGCPRGEGAQGLKVRAAVRWPQ
jgi:hypothetical protein